MINKSTAWDEIDSPEDIWKSDKENDMGYECECGHIPSFKELKNGICPRCKDNDD